MERGGAQESMQEGAASGLLLAQRTPVQDDVQHSGVIGLLVATQQRLSGFPSTGRRRLGDKPPTGPTHLWCPAFARESRMRLDCVLMPLVVGGHIVQRVTKEPTAAFERSAWARRSSRRASTAGVIASRASLPAANTLGGWSMSAIWTSASPSAAGSSGCWPW